MDTTCHRLGPQCPGLSGYCSSSCDETQRVPEKCSTVRLYHVLSKSQKPSFNANCRMRGSPARWIWPNAALFKADTGGAKFAWLRILKASLRSCRVFPSLMLNVRDKARSNWNTPGP